MKDRDARFSLFFGVPRKTVRSKTVLLDLPKKILFNLGAFENPPGPRHVFFQHLLLGPYSTVGTIPVEKIII